MRFDDRLRTVLSSQPESAHDNAVRWRQLVELVSRPGVNGDLRRQALAEVEATSQSVAVEVRAATARSIAGPRLDEDLVALFAADEVAVSAPILSAVKLDMPAWQRILELAHGESRRFIQALHPELRTLAQIAERVAPKTQRKPDGEQPANGQKSPPAELPVDRAPLVGPATIPSINEMVSRIERLQTERQTGDEQSQVPLAAPASVDTQPDPASATREPEEAPALFRWEAGASGDISWVGGAPRGAIVGRSLCRHLECFPLDRKVAQAFALRAPFSGGRFDIPGNGALSGGWRISGIPAFHPGDGRFSGYRGVAVRDVSEASQQPAQPARPALDDDSIRELVHEVKTPLNAIIGFAEIIDGQYLGPADHHYRARAAEIVEQARILLAAIEDMDVAARRRPEDRQDDASVDLVSLVLGLAPGLVERAERDRVTVTIRQGRGRVRCRGERPLLERLVRRFLETCVAMTASGESAAVRVESELHRCRIAVAISVRAAQRGEADARDSMPADVSMRLVRSLAAVAGGEIVTGDEEMALILPRARE